MNNKPDPCQNRSLKKYNKGVRFLSGAAASPSPPPSPQSPPLRSVLTPGSSPAAFAAVPPQVRRTRMRVEVSKALVDLESAGCCCAGKAVSAALSSLTSHLDSLTTLLSFAAPAPSSQHQLVTSFLPARSFCTQKWFQASNESQTLPSDPPWLYSFSSVSSSLNTLALPCEKLRRERKPRVTSEAVVCVVASSQVRICGSVVTLNYAIWETEVLVLSTL